MVTATPPRGAAEFRAQAVSPKSSTQHSAVTIFIEFPSGFIRVDDRPQRRGACVPNALARRLSVRLFALGQQTVDTANCIVRSRVRARQPAKMQKRTDLVAVRDSECARKLFGRGVARIS